ncbi:Elongation of very long chain fatty acids protein 7 [Zootermopsis nevadensis]|uniref:Elongation of very long chain fatty acids protein n=1 Tax=Zootermopsis nevadensis TaxID=136037 RepID=A0A067QQL4_ZOONE|nr:Elongation of very long chain fatty acids protein 7 [Zootermopsis nevadensis]
MNGRGRTVKMSTLTYLLEGNHKLVRGPEIDKMVNDWFLMSNPATMLFIVACYLLFVLKVGPKLMASRKPFNLQVLMVVYNFAMVLVSLYISLLVSPVQQLWTIVSFCVFREIFCMRYAK